VYASVGIRPGPLAWDLHPVIILGYGTLWFGAFVVA
jgi:hypothetical protein